MGRRRGVSRADDRAKSGAASDPLSGFLPPVGRWFADRFGEPTPPQKLGWPEVAKGRHTLIFAPTGSGKTLAAFLSCLDHLWRVPPASKGVRVLYISPLKALNQDISRNLEGPLAEILMIAEAMGTPLRTLTTAVRSGDTSAAERQRIVRRPPDLLITTPESLHLMLTSRAVETLRTVSHVIVDEIHALAPNKRGVFLSLLLERLEDVVASPFVRVGLSATQRPLEEVARYLGGRRKVRGRGASARFEPRPVTIVDAGRRKELDLLVSYPPGADGPPSQGGAWPSIEEFAARAIAEHRSTIVFVNNRRVAERLTARLNERAEAERAPDLDADPPPVARSHHGSLSLEARRATEAALKAGELPAVVATASLELGIDMGAVDLVLQVESPGSVARGLQRVGRAGHVVGRTSKGRLLAKTPGDLLESAALAAAMLDGRVEKLRVPSNCLDVLAQQVVAVVAGGVQNVADLFDFARRAYPYRDLTPAAFEAVLKMISGRFGFAALRDLKPRVSWDRVRNTLAPLPGTKSLAVIGGGTIPDTGQYPLHLGSADGPRLGELDEEFVLERRVGETFRLGASTWRIESIDPQKVVVSAAAGASAFLPFWRGESIGRTSELGKAVGELCRELADGSATPDRLRDRYRLDSKAAASLVGFARRQKIQGGAIPDDRTVVVEAFRDPAGEVGLAVLTPFGGKLHHALKLALQARLRRRLGIEVACLHADDGLLIRLPGLDEPPLDVFEGLTPELAEELIREGLGDSALFGLRFRQNAARALLMPRPDPAKRTPLWLQRLRARDLLQAVRRFPDFPIVVETVRECLDDDLDLPALREFLDSIRGGSIRVATRRGDDPSPFASELVFRFTQAYLYEWDEPRRGDRPQSTGFSDALLDPLLVARGADELLDADAIARVERRLRGLDRPPRSVDEMAERLRELGDLAEPELSGPMLGFLDTLRTTGRAAVLTLPGVSRPERWVAAEESARYRAGFEAEGPQPPPIHAEPPADPEEARRAIVLRYLSTRALVGLDDLSDRYPLDPVEAEELLEASAAEGDLVRIEGGGDGPDRWADRRNLEEARRLTLALRRQESVAVTPEQFADFVLRRQRAHPSERLEGEAAVPAVLDLLRGHPASLDLWETGILPARIVGFRPSALSAAVASGGWAWRASEEGRGEPLVAFFDDNFGGLWPSTDAGNSIPSIPSSAAVLEHLRGRGALTLDELAKAVGLSPTTVKAAIRVLTGLGKVRADRLDPLRVSGELAPPSKHAPAATGIVEGRRGRPRLGSARRPTSIRPEPRWLALDDSKAADDPDASILAWADAILDRYGVACRETVGMDPWAPRWREVVLHLAKAELRGELRRGYFVEGLSGVQYALPEAAEALSKQAGLDRDPTPVLLQALDPANLYGSGAPLDVPLLEGGTARFLRNPGNSQVLIAGAPTLIIESRGRRLTGLGSASEADLRASIALLPDLSGPPRRVLRVETYNSGPVLASPAVPWLTEAGFVRDYAGMIYYPGF